MLPLLPKLCIFHRLREESLTRLAVFIKNLLFVGPPGRSGKADRTKHCFGGQCEGDAHGILRRFRFWRELCLFFVWIEHDFQVISKVCDLASYRTAQQQLPKKKIEVRDVEMVLNMAYNMPSVSFRHVSGFMQLVLGPPSQCSGLRPASDSLPEVG